MKHTGPDPKNEGFALALVVVLLFAVGVLGATGYQIALLSSALSTQGSEGQRSLAVARAGLQRYIGEQIGTPDDTVAYVIDGGDAVVTSRRVASISDHESLYLISSEGVYLAPTSTGAPARRTVHQYAKRRAAALDFDAALTVASGAVLVQPGGRIDGRDQAAPADCMRPAADVAGLLLANAPAAWDGVGIMGAPDTIRAGSYDAVLDELGLSWDVLNDPAFPVDFQDAWPGQGIPADSFPVVRFSSSVTATSATSGRGVLIVQGELMPESGFTWAGIVLAGRLAPPTSGAVSAPAYAILGVTVVGLDDSDALLTVADRADILYHRCFANAAGNSIAYFRPIDDAWWEASGW